MAGTNSDPDPLVDALGAQAALGAGDWTRVRDEDELLDELARRVSVRVLGAPRDSVTRARSQLDEYFGGERAAFDVRLDWRLTRGFRREVLRATAQIPYGATRSYRQVATQAGSPAAVRAAGTALATNPLPIVVPCHRVLRSDGQLGAYRGGAAAKAQLLALGRVRFPGSLGPRLAAGSRCRSCSVAGEPSG